MWTGQEMLDALGGLYQGVINKAIAAVIILLIGFIIGKVVAKIFQKFLAEIELNKMMKKAAGIKVSLEEILSYFVQYFIYFIFIIMALNQLGLTTTILNMLSGAIIIVIIISIFLGIKDFIPNFIAGMFIHSKGFIKEGDHIKVKDVQGKIVKINMVETRIETKSGDLIYLPNTMLTKQEVIKLKHAK